MKTAGRSTRRPHATGRLPTFLIVGAPRCGTTSISAYLAEHPDVFVAPQKEVRFFDEHYDRGAEWYRAQFEGAAGERLTGEASPRYMFEEAAMQRMASLLPDIKLVAMLREPVARAYSAYWFRRGLGGETLSFEEAIEQEKRPGFVAKPKLPLLLTSSFYLPALERVCRYYPRDRLLVLLLEDLRRDPEETFGSLCSFLGIDASVKPPRLGAPVNRTYRLRSRRLYRGMIRYGLWRRLPFRLGFKIDELNRETFSYPEMNPDTRRRLRAMFAEHNTSLARWLGRDLSLWDESG